MHPDKNSEEGARDAFQAAAEAHQALTDANGIADALAAAARRHMVQQRRPLWERYRRTASYKVDVAADGLSTHLSRQSSGAPRRPATAPQGATKASPAANAVPLRTAQRAAASQAKIRPVSSSRGVGTGRYSATAGVPPSGRVRPARQRSATAADGPVRPSAAAPSRPSTAASPADAGERLAKEPLHKVQRKGSAYGQPAGFRPGTAPASPYAPAASGLDGAERPARAAWAQTNIDSHIASWLKGREAKERDRGERARRRMEADSRWIETMRQRAYAGGEARAAAV